MSSWLAKVRAGESDGEFILVQHFTNRLVELARRKLPKRLRGRMDPEDVVQSVYRSFFRRIQSGQFQLDDSLDTWRLLAAMTYHKATKAVRFHTRQRRDVRRDMPFNPMESDDAQDPSDPSPSPDDVATLLDCAEKLCSSLPEHHRDVFLLRLEGHSIQEIAQRVRRSQGTVLRVLARVRELAAKQLEEVA